MTYAAFPSALYPWILDGRLPRPAGEGEAMAWVSAAAAQGLAGLLAAALPEDGSWPRPAAERLRNLYALALQRGLTQADSARSLRRTLALQAIRALPLKGAALADRLYDSPAERPMVDVDLLVLDRWPVALAAVEAAGWRAADEGDHAVAFEDPQTGAVVELHHSVTSCPGFHPVDAEGMWARSIPGTDEGRLPSPEDLLVHLSLHTAFQHGFAVSLVQLLDVRRVLERLSPDVGRLVSIAAGAQAGHAVGATLLVAREVVGAAVSAELQAAFVDGLPRGLERWLAARLRAGDVGRESAAALARARWELAAGRRAELVRRTVSPASARHRNRAGLFATARRVVSLVRRWGPPLVSSGLSPRVLTRRV